MTTERTFRPGRLGWLVILAGLAGLSVLAIRPAGGGSDLGEIEFTVKSEYSHIRLRRLNSVRTLGFVRDNGEEVVESMVDLRRKHDLLVTYTRFMFLSYVFKPQHERVLIVGLGGGSMVHFLKHYDPKLKVDVVEIDPVIVKMAEKYSELESAGNVTIHTKDGFEYLRTTKERYDAIYMDAFLKPSRDTDNTGVPLNLRTKRFYNEVQRKLTPDGMVVFNINPHHGLRDDLDNIRDAFPQMYDFGLPGYNGHVVVGSMSAQRLAKSTILEKARELDRRFPASYSYLDMARRLEK